MILQTEVGLPGRTARAATRFGETYAGVAYGWFVGSNDKAELAFVPPDEHKGRIRTVIGPARQALERSHVTITQHDR